jgi:CheY-specific phosphatase CheX
MPETIVEQALGRAAEDVLEKMFFAGLVGDFEPNENAGPSIAIRMAFEGQRQGVLGLRISTSAARTLAADFLGVETEDGPNEAQVCDVVRELANMICGDVLSALEKSPLRLSAPEIVPSAEFAVPAAGSFRSFDLGDGELTLALTFREGTRG